MGDLDSLTDFIMVERPAWSLIDVKRQQRYETRSAVPVNEIRGYTVEWRKVAAVKTVQSRNDDVFDSMVEEKSGRAKTPSGMTKELLSVVVFRRLKY